MEEVNGAEGAAQEVKRSAAHEGGEHGEKRRMREEGRGRTKTC